MLEKFITHRIIAELPFVPNEGQAAVIEQLARFLTSRDDRRVFILKGYAGTGKTSLVSALVRALEALQHPCTLLAPTGRAAKVIAHYAAHPAYTIHKWIYRQQQDGRFALTDNLFRGRLFIVDEASMISGLRDNAAFGSGCLLDDLIQYVYAGLGCTLLLLGDDAQLPPVGQQQSLALQDDYIRGYGLNVLSGTLTEVARQADDSGILFNATAVRNLLTNGALTSPFRLSFGPDVISLDAETFRETLERSYRDEGLDETLVITRSNRRTNLYNQGIRNSILWREELLSAGDRIMVSRNNYYWNKTDEHLPSFLANGDILQVRRVRNRRELYGFNFIDAEMYHPDYEQEITATLWLDTLTTDTPEDSYHLQQTLFERIADDFPEIRNKRDLRKAVMDSPYYNALQIRFAYAVTCHKAQGGQWRHIYIDPGPLTGPDQPTQTTGNMTTTEWYRWLYTALTRATQRIYWLGPPAIA
ncbi:MAG: AAA family ATPase [Paludibacteraceae bacterium]|nr:AAA family ATPase [Paludibacteraceae bacterium]